MESYCIAIPTVGTSRIKCADGRIDQKEVVFEVVLPRGGHPVPSASRVFVATHTYIDVREYGCLLD